MKLIAFVIFALYACSSITNSNDEKYFEGKIIYQTSAESKVPYINAADLLKMSGDSSTFYFKEGNFRQFYDAQGLLEEFYIKKDNKGFIKKNNSDTLFWYNRAKPSEKIIKYTLNRKVEKILGIECDELVTNYENKIITYYFNTDSLKIKSEWYKDFKFSNKDFITQQMGTLYLRCKMEYPQVVFTITATSISHEKVDDKMFKIPTSAILIEDLEN